VPLRTTVIMSMPALLLAVQLVACGAIDGDTPARNPLAERAASAAASAPATVPAASPTPPPTPPIGSATPPPASLAEAATARAIELLAEWLGVPQTQFAVVSAEAVVWPDACLGLAQPIACTQVVTPGFRVRLRDALGAAHTVHTDANGSRIRWAGEASASGIVTAIDLGARRFTVATTGRSLELRIAPGTSWIQSDTPATLVGRSVTLAYDPAPAAAGPPSAAWVVLDPP